MGNLGDYQWITTVSKKVGGPGCSQPPWRSAGTWFCVPRKRW